MIAFEPTEEQKLMQTSVAQFARMLRTRMREFEHARALPDDVRKAANELGLTTMALPESLGGGGLGMTTSVLLEEEVAYGDPAAAFAFGGPGAFGLAVAELAGEAQAKTLLAPFGSAGEGWRRVGAVAWGEPRPHPSLSAAFSTTAVKNGTTWTLTGEKAYVMNADRADVILVFAQIEQTKPATQTSQNAESKERAPWDGVGAFVVEKGAAGLRILPRERTLGLDVASVGGVALDGVAVDESSCLIDPTGGEHVDRVKLVRFFAKHALLVAARSVGLARAAFDVTREYCEGRRAFGKPIGHFQAVAFTLADRAMDVDAARGLVWNAAWAWDAGTDGALLATARAVAFAHETAMRCGDDGVQLHGGAGFMRDYPVEKWMRDAKQLQVCALTPGHADHLASSIELRGAADLAFSLPSAESQNVFL